MEEKKSGLEKVLSGECPLGNVNPMACMFCPYGHLSECHYPFTCDEIDCSHYQQLLEEEELEEEEW